MTPRRLFVLINQMPQKSRFMRAMFGEIVDWTMDTYIMARAANLVQIGNNQRARQRTNKGDLIQPPSHDAVKAPEKKIPKPLPKEERPNQKGWKDLDKLFGVGG